MTLERKKKNPHASSPTRGCEEGGKAAERAAQFDCCCCCFRSLEAKTTTATTELWQELNTDRLAAAGNALNYGQPSDKAAGGQLELQCVRKN